jgi:hypothetical protein
VNDLVREAAEHYGSLRSVAGVHAFRPNAARDSRYDEYVFAFDRGSLTVTAEPSDDSIHLGGTGATLPHVTDLSNEEPWARLIGCGILWIWRLTNHNGFVDGLQLELGQPGECWSVQLMCEGSALSARSLGSLDRMSNLIG